MQLHNLTKNSARKRKVRIGRGGKRGSFSGRGIKGQKARAGRRIRPEIRDLVMKMPKRRGHRHTGPATNIQVVTASAIAKKFTRIEHVNPKTIVERGLAHRIHGRVPRIKIVGPFAKIADYSIKGVEFTRRAPAR